MLWLGDPGWGGEGWLFGWRCFSHPNPWQKISGFEDANLCRKCRLSVEHFVSSRKTTTKKAKCGVFVFLYRNVYRFSEVGGREWEVSHPRPRYLGWIWGHFCAQSPSPQLLSEGNIDDFGVKELKVGGASCKAEFSWQQNLAWGTLTHHFRVGFNTL